MKAERGKLYSRMTSDKREREKKAGQTKPRHLVSLNQTEKIRELKEKGSYRNEKAAQRKKIYGDQRKEGIILRNGDMRRWGRAALS